MATLVLDTISFISLIYSTSTSGKKDAPDNDTRHKE